MTRFWIIDEIINPLNIHVLCVLFIVLYTTTMCFPQCSDTCQCLKMARWTPFYMVTKATHIYTHLYIFVWGIASTKEQKGKAGQSKARKRKNRQGQQYTSEPEQEREQQQPTEKSIKQWSKLMELMWEQENKSGKGCRNCRNLHSLWPDWDGKCVLVGNCFRSFIIFSSVQFI